MYLRQTLPNYPVSQLPFVRRTFLYDAKKYLTEKD